MEFELCLSAQSSYLHSTLPLRQPVPPGRVPTGIMPLALCEQRQGCHQQTSPLIASGHGLANMKGSGEKVGAQHTSLSNPRIAVFIFSFWSLPIPAQTWQCPYQLFRNGMNLQSVLPWAMADWPAENAHAGTDLGDGGQSLLDLRFADKIV